MLLLGDCLERMGEMAPDSVDAIVTDPPYGIGFMGKAWDGKDIAERHKRRSSAASRDPGTGDSGGYRSAAAAAGAYDLSPKGMRAFQEFSREWAVEALRVAKPGAHCVAFASPRTFHRMVCGLEEAGWEIRDTLMWVFGSGFPKSHNGDWGGTALKPAWEPILLARKPLAGTVAANHAEHGTGGLNIDACRIQTEDVTRGSGQPPLTFNGQNARPFHSREGEASQDRRYSEAGGTNFAAAPGPRGGDPAGRWPANLVHDGSDEVVAAFPQAPGQQGDLTGDEPSRPFRNAYGVMNGHRVADKRGDSGSAARFFYCAKASRADRNAGMDDPGPQFKMGARPCDYEAVNSAGKGNHHPTVKPTELMRWLCRLVTPAGGLVLDPFTGSGSTGRGAVLEGLRFVGCELDPQYVAIAEARIAEAAALAREEAEAQRHEQAQQPLF